MNRLPVALILLSALPIAARAETGFSCGSPTPFQAGGSTTQVEIRITERKNSDGTWAELSVSAKSSDSNDNFFLSYPGSSNGKGDSKVNNLSDARLWLLESEDTRGTKKHFQLSRNGASFVYWTMEHGTSSIRQVGGGCRQVS
jgi:hypothetical protein